MGFDMEIVSANREIPHHRKLEINFSDGRTLVVRFDQIRESAIGV